MTAWQVEVTDTFAGESNYSWVRRYRFNAPDGTCDNGIIRRARAVAGVRGRAKRVDYFWDGMAVWNPGGDCIVMFITECED